MSIETYRCEGAQQCALVQLNIRLAELKAGGKTVTHNSFGSCMKNATGNPTCATTYEITDISPRDESL